MFGQFQASGDKASEISCNITQKKFHIFLGSTLNNFKLVGAARTHSQDLVHKDLFNLHEWMISRSVGWLAPFFLYPVGTAPEFHLHSRVHPLWPWHLPSHKTWSDNRLFVKLHVKCKRWTISRTNQNTVMKAMMRDDRLTIPILAPRVSFEKHKDSDFDGFVRGTVPDRFVSPERPWSVASKIRHGCFCFYVPQHWEATSWVQKKYGTNREKL